LRTEQPQIFAGASNELVQLILFVSQSLRLILDQSPVKPDFFFSAEILEILVKDIPIKINCEGFQEAVIDSALRNSRLYELVAVLARQDVANAKRVDDCEEVFEVVVRITHFQ
jgi:hypothetical protein